MSTQYDVIAIGAGSGGLSVVERAASYGARCLVIEKGLLGGTCVNVGCVPKKILWNAAHIAHVLEDAKGYGFSLEVKGFSWAQLKEKRDQYIHNINAWYVDYLKDSKVDLVAGEACFVNNKTVSVNGVEYSAKHIVIATGGRPAIPADVPGAEFGITSDDFFLLPEQPKRVAVIGGGYIAVELAQVLHGLGSQAHLLCRKENVLRNFDPYLTEHLKTELENTLSFHTESPIKAIEKNTDGSLTVVTARESIVVDCVIWAVGRHLNTDKIGLEHTDIQPDAQGVIATNKFQETSVAGVFALGDIVGKFPLTPVAIAAGRRLADRLYGGREGRYLPYENIPSIVFTHPPIGVVGLTEKAARAQYSQVKCYTTAFTSMYSNFSPAPVKTAMKLVCVGVDEKIVGVHLFGPQVDEMLQGFAVAVRMGALKRDFDDTVALHPTAAEELVTMR